MALPEWPSSSSPPRVFAAAPCQAPRDRRVEYLKENLDSASKILAINEERYGRAGRWFLVTVAQGLDSVQICRVGKRLSGG